VANINLVHDLPSSEVFQIKGIPAEHANLSMRHLIGIIKIPKYIKMVSMKLHYKLCDSPPGRNY
jgi:hypothetical protein